MNAELTAQDEPGEGGSPLTRTAIALRYRHGTDAAPAVTAAGHGDVAERIIDTALREGVPVREDADLAQAMAHLEIDDLVPPELYRVIAELLAWAYRMNHRYLLDPGG